MSQEKKILEYMRNHGSITSLDAALHIRCLALPQRIFDLKAKGYKIVREIETKKNRDGETIQYARYRLG